MLVLSAVLVGLTLLAIVGGLMQLGSELRRLREDFDGVHAPPPPTTGTHAVLRYGALFEEKKASPLDALREVAGGPAVAVAVPLALLTLITGFLGARQRGASLAPPPAAQVASADSASGTAPAASSGAPLAHGDSLSRELAALRDSVTRLTAALAASSKAAPPDRPGRTAGAPAQAASRANPTRAAGTVAPRPAPASADVILPPPPSLGGIAPAAPSKQDSPRPNP